MTGLVSLKAGTNHALRPLWVNPELCHTAEIADGTQTGQRMQYTQSHFLHYRFNGLCHWSHIARSEDTGTIYVILNFPTRRDAGTQKLAVFMGGHSVAGALLPTDWTLVWRDAFNDATVWSDDIMHGPTGVVSFQEGNAVVDYQPPSGTGADSVKVIEFKYTDFNPTYFCAYHIGDAQIPVAQRLVGEADCSSGRVISESDSSYNGLVKAVGTGADNVESIERLTRRVFFNQSHPEGSVLSSADSDETYENMFTSHVFAARCRNLLGDDNPKYCYPCAVIQTLNSNFVAGRVRLRFKNMTTAETWEYQVPVADTPGTPLFIHPWRTGSSSASGLLVQSDADCNIKVEGYTSNTDRITSLTLLSWALFEGPAY